MKLVILPEPTRENLIRFTKFTHSDHKNIFGLDVETTAITDQGVFDPNARMRLIQFGTAQEGWVLDPSKWSERITKFVSDPGMRFVSHTDYDVMWVRREFTVDLDDRAIDTIIMANLLEPGPFNRHDLKHLTTRYFGTRLSAAEDALHARFRELAPSGYRQGKKMVGWGFDNIALDDPAYTRYAALDAIYVRRLLDKLGDAVQAAGMSALSRREQIVARLATDMQWRGMKADRARVNELLREIGGDLEAAEHRLVEAFGFKARSPKRVEWLEEHGVRFTAKTPTGRGELSKDTLPGLVRQYGKHKIVGPVLADLEILSTRQNIANNLRAILRSMDADGRVHPNINTCQAVTGRMSVTGVAMQTFKKNDKRLRGCFVAKPGYIFVGADYDSQEIRLAVAYSRDPLMSRIVADGLNQHDETLAAILEQGIDADRMAAKILNFAQQYGAGPKAIAKQIGVSLGEARALWLAWREAYAGLVEWSAQMAELPVVVNPWGRRIPRDGARGYANGNYMIQSSGRDVLGDAMVSLREAGWSKYLWLPIHDELVLEVPVGKAEEACRVLAHCMWAKVAGIELTASPEVVGKRWGGVE